MYVLGQLVNSKRVESWDMCRQLLQNAPNGAYWQQSKNLRNKNNDPKVQEEKFMYEKIMK